MSEWRIAIETDGPRVLLAARERTGARWRCTIDLHRRSAAGVAAILRAAVADDDDTAAEITTALNIEVS